MKIIGLTGGISSGKTTVSHLFELKYHVPIIDADEISRSLLSGSLNDISSNDIPTSNTLSNESPSSALIQIKDLFGLEIFNDDGSLNRQKLKDLMFSDSSDTSSKSEYKTQIESILHPIVYKTINTKIQAYLKQKIPYIIISIPLLFETGNKNLFDRILLVSISKTIQIKRCLQRDKNNKEQVISIIDSQMPNAEKITLSDDIINNNFSLKNLKKNVYKLHQQYMAMSQPLS